MYGKLLIEEALTIFKILKSNFYILYKEEYENYLRLYEKPNF